ncbi:MAG: hypothetical protein K5925_03240 [Bacilli bacterium]|nr:hypothetical protein [Bacilli bacterium]
MLDQFERFDMKASPKRPKLRLLSYLLAIGPVKKHKGIIKKINMDGIKPPYLLLANHNAFMDINVLSVATFPHPLNYVIAIDGFLNRELLLRHIGGICKRKFTNDFDLIKHLKYVIDHKRVAAIFPEARYSLCGTKAIIPSSVARLCRYLNVPVVMLKMHGHHINSPFWNLHDRGVQPIEAELYPLVTQDEIANLSLEEINQRIQDNFEYDEYSWQKERNIHVTYEGRAEGLHKVLYKCPHCGKEYRMNSKGIYLFCEECGKKWEYTELGELKAVEGETEFSHIPDWYEWERAEVRKEVDAGTYHFEGEVHIDLLPKDKFFHLGKGYLVHDMNGFKLTGEYEGEKFEVAIPPQNSYGVHIEYEYLGKYGDCVDLNVPNDTFYVYPHGRDFAVTKFSLATEELFKKYQEKHVVKKD